MDTFERNAVRSLAVSYCAYMEQVNKPEKDATRLMSWARCLLNAQRAVGIELLPSVTLLYPLTGDDVTIERIVSNDRWIEVMATELTTVDPEPSRGVLRSQSGMIEGPDDCDGGAKVPAPVAPPRKPSPSAALSPAARAQMAFASQSLTRRIGV